jgi:hypothetical protein
MSMSIFDLYCSVDSFWQRFEPRWERELLASGQRQRRRATRLHPAEIMTILILFQQSGYRTFKGFYTQHVRAHLRSEFPQLVSYTRFVDLMPRFLVPLAIYLHTQLGPCTGISFIDATSLAVCHPARIRQHRVFAVDARRGKTSVGWFYGFKLHVVVNDRGDLLAVCLSPGNLDDRRPVPRLVRRLFGGSLATKATSARPRRAPLAGARTASHHQTAQQHAESAHGSCRQALLRKRALIESINDQLKNVCQIEPVTAVPPTSLSTSPPASSPTVTSPRSRHCTSTTGLPR